MGKIIGRVSERVCGWVDGLVKVVRGGVGVDGWVRWWMGEWVGTSG